MDVPKETFIAGLEKEFQRLKNQDIHQFSSVHSGHCGGDCNNGCGGYTFLTNNNQALDLLFVEENGEITDLYKCSIFNNDTPIKNKSKIYLSFYDDEKTDYIPSERNKSLQNQIENIFYDLNKFKNNVTDIETFFKWSIQVENFYDSINIYERISLKFVKPISDLFHKNSYIQSLITFYPFANKAMKDFKSLDKLNESELIEWVLKYDDNELSYGDYIKVNNWEQNNLIQHAFDNSIVLDCSKYAQSLQFSEIQPKHYWELFEKYKITSTQFNDAKAHTIDLQYKLNTFLNIEGINQQLDIIKIENKPVYLKYVIGEPKPTDQFIVIAGIELGINVKPEQIGSANSFIDENGATQIESSPEHIKNEIDNKKADEFYSQEIGPDWKNIFQNKIEDLFNENQVDSCPF
jgi:hypothetical protein